jgi:hypothetical protein
MAGKQRLAPRLDLWYRLVDEEQDWDSPQREDGHNEHDELPKLDPKLGRLVRAEGKPCTNINETCTVEHEVDHCCKDLALDLRIEVTVPRYGTACVLMRILDIAHEQDGPTCSKRSQEVVDPKRTANTNGEEAQGEVLGNK